MIESGTRVRLSDELKIIYRGKCIGGIHVGPFDSSDDSHSCYGCSSGHVEEFGDCIGVVEDLVDYNREGECDPAKIGPEVNVRWEPSGLRYGYDEKYLIIVI